ncbi:ParB/RepB/Spo0J family partition protein [Sandaracinobacteroides saxicola]|uniref:ParB/RepB/Spo0J family partition protein n=1 Tax=Sandaracinobacteroides saxicola TaxID=2759707 RepID=A0A7G5IH78_9SPHN|nr:ParB/RepB/Spo0J family partition protein [Sandaracinobacteroides saxicola]QMW22720.1 ParB/RepB/Spo0J family partition protein [Sandaracinobacteroides saxicola]
MTEAAAKRGLGRGLSALLDEMGAPAKPKSGDTLMLPIAMIAPNPDQPRRHFDPAALEELASSIRNMGLLQPIVVTAEREGRHIIVAGERRWRAARMAGRHDIPVIIHDVDGESILEAALVENIQRAELNPMEEAQAYRQLMYRHQVDHELMAKRVGKSRSHISNMVRLVYLPEEVQAMVADGRLSLGHAKVLAGVEEPLALARRVVEQALTVRQLEALVRAKGMAKPRKAKPARDADIEALERNIADSTGLKTRIEAKDGAGQVTLSFSSLDQLDLIVARLGSGSF